MIINSKSWRICAATVSLTALTVLAGCATATSEPDESSESDAIAEMDPVNIIVAEPLAPTSSNNLGTNAWMDYITERTDGKVTFEVYDTSTLHPMQEALSALESGLSDVTLYIPGLFPTEAPAGAWASGLGAFTGATPMEMMAGSVAASAAFQTTDGIVDELAQHNAVIVGTFASDSYSLLCTEPVETLADADGKLARTSGGVYGPEAESIGMSPVLMDANEVYEGLQRGTINCQLGALQSFLTEGLVEVAKYHTALPFSPNTGAGYIMNKEKYDALPDEVKQIFADASPLFGIGNNERVLERYVEFYGPAAEEFGLTFVNPDDELLDTLLDFRQSQGAALVDTAPPSVTDPQATVDLFQSTYAEWVEILADEFGLEETDGSAEANLAVYEYLTEEFDWEAYRERWAAYIAELD